MPSVKNGVWILWDTTKPDGNSRSFMMAHVLVWMADMMGTKCQLLACWTQELVKEIYLPGFMERTRLGDTSANLRKLKTHLLLKSYQFLKEGEL